MQSSPPAKGRPVTLTGLRMIVSVMAGFQLLALLAVALLGDGFLEHDDDLTLPLLGALVGLALLEAVFFVVLRLKLRARWRAELQESPYTAGGSLPGAFVTVTIIGAAMAEGVGLFGAVIYLLTGSLPALALAVLAILLTLAQLPREASLSS